MRERQISLDALLMEFDWMDGWHYWFPVDIPHAFSNCIIQSFRFFSHFSLEGVLS